MFETIKRLLSVAILVAVSAVAVHAAGLLPPGEAQFIDGNGAPYAGGTITFYIPGTTTPKDTYQDSGQSILNANPLTLDAAGRAIIYGVGTYRQILKDANGITIWDQLTADPASSNTSSWAGTSGGTANAQTLTSGSYAALDGQTIGFVAGFTNTGPLTLNISGQGPTAVYKDTLTGPTTLTGGEVRAGNVYQATYGTTLGAFHLSPIWPLTTVIFGPQTSIASAATTDLGTVASNNALITGNAVITSFGSSAATTFRSIYQIAFSGTPTLTYNATTLITPASQNIYVQAGSSATALYLGAGAWQILAYQDNTYIPGVQPVAGGFKNLVVTGTGNATATTTADEISLEDTSGRIYRATSVNVTHTITTAGANGLDTGAEAASTWYSTWVIYNPTTNTVASLLSVSATAPTMPSGYTYKARTGWVRNDASLNLWRSIQRGRRAQIIFGTNPTNLSTSSAVMATGPAGSYTVPTWVSVATGSFVPSTASTIYVTSMGGVNTGVAIAPNNSYFTTTGAAGPLTYYSASNNVAGQQTSLSAPVPIVLETTNIFWASTSVNYLYCVGWDDNLN